jgi:hypothetical protein
MEPKRPLCTVTVLDGYRGEITSKGEFAARRFPDGYRVALIGAADNGAACRSHPSSATM